MTNFEVKEMVIEFKLKACEVMTTLTEQELKCTTEYTVDWVYEIEYIINRVVEKAEEIDSDIDYVLELAGNKRYRCEDEFDDAYGECLSELETFIEEAEKELEILKNEAMEELK